MSREMKTHELTVNYILVLTAKIVVVLYSCFIDRDEVRPSQGDTARVFLG